MSDARRPPPLSLAAVHALAAQLDVGEQNTDDVVGVVGMVVRRKVLSRFLCLVTLRDAAAGAPSTAAEHTRVPAVDSEAHGVGGVHEDPTVTVVLKDAALGNDDAPDTEDARTSRVKDASAVCAVGATVHVTGILERTARGDVAVVSVACPTLLTPAAAHAQPDASTAVDAPQHRAVCRALWAQVVKGASNGCARGDACPYSHDMELLWERARKLGVQVGESAASHADKKHRFEAFAAWLGEHFSVECLRSGPVVDIAGGKGHLGVWLYRKFGVETVVVDPSNHTRDRRSQQRLKEHRVTKVTARIDRVHQIDDPTLRGALANASVIVGLHPDEATDLVVHLALAHNKPFAVVPCCVFPTLFPHRRLEGDQPVVSTGELITYLEQTAAAGAVPTAQARLPIEGRNVVLHSAAITPLVDPA